MPRVTITVPDKKSQPYRFALDRESVTLGRGSENDIVIDDASASVRHAVMERVSGGYQLRDLGSTNGTKLDGKARDQIELTDGLTVKIGDVDFDFSLSPEEKLTLAGERSGTGASPILKEDEVEAPRRKVAPRHAPTPPLASASQPSAAAAFFMTLIFLVLAAGAFFIGMSIRHQKDLGRSLMQDIREGNSAPAEATGGDAVPVPAVEVPDTE